MRKDTQIDMQIVELNLEDLNLVSGGSGGKRSVLLGDVLDVLKFKIGKETIAGYMTITKSYAIEQCTELAIPHLLGMFPGYTSEEMRAAITMPGNNFVVKSINLII